MLAQLARMTADRSAVKGSLLVNRQQWLLTDSAVEIVSTSESYTVSKPRNRPELKDGFIRGITLHTGVKTFVCTLSFISCSFLSNVVSFLCLLARM